MVPKISLRIVDEVSIMDRKQFEMALPNLGYFRCSSPDVSGACELPRCGVLVIMISMYYDDLLPVVPYLKSFDYDGGNGRYVNISLLYHLLWS